MSSATRTALAEINDYVERALVYLDNRVTPATAASVHDWLSHLRIARGLTAGTIETYCKAIAGFLGWLKNNNIALGDVTATDLDNWQKHLFIERRLSERTRRKLLTAMRRYFAWHQQYHGGPNPASDIVSPKVGNTVPRKFETSELRKLFESCDQETPLGVRDFSLLLFACTTGARREEIQSLKLDQLHFTQETGRVTIYGKGKKERAVTFGKEVVNAIRRWLIIRDDIDVIDRDALWVGVGPRRKGQRMTLTGVDQILRRRVKKLKIKPKGLHAMRVTFATDMYDSGENIEVIQNLMGHESIETTRRYIVISERNQRARISTQRINEITGGDTNELPLWARNKQ